MGTVATLTSVYNVPLPLMKTADVVTNSGHCIYSIGLKCFGNYLSLLHLVFYLLQSNRQYFVIHLERLTYHYIYMHTYIYMHIYIISKRSIIPQYIKYNSGAIGVIQSLYFGSKLLSSQIK